MPFLKLREILEISAQSAGKKLGLVLSLHKINNGTRKLHRDLLLQKDVKKHVPTSRLEYASGILYNVPTSRLTKHNTQKSFKL